MQQIFENDSNKRVERGQRNLREQPAERGLSIRGLSRERLKTRAIAKKKGGRTGRPAKLS